MADLAFYKAKLSECLQLLESSSDPLYRDVYQAMADEFAEKLAAMEDAVAEAPPADAPPSALLHQVARPEAASFEAASFEPASFEAGDAAGEAEPGALPAGVAAGHEVDRRRRRRGVGLAVSP